LALITEQRDRVLENRGNLGQRYLTVPQVLRSICTSPLGREPPKAVSCHLLLPTITFYQEHSLSKPALEQGQRCDENHAASGAKLTAIEKFELLACDFP
jgi:hypothetical protein